MHGSVLTSAYLVSVMALDRLLAIKAPIWHRNNASNRTVNIVLAVVISFCFGCTSTSLFFFHVDDDGVCKPNDELHPQFFQIYSFVVTFVFLFTVPICLLVFANMVFIRSLFKRTSALNTMKGQNTETYCFLSE